jgi:phage RecT family recombinase
MEQEITTISGFKNKAFEMMQENGFPVERIKREISFALQHFGKNDYLNKSTPESKLKAVVNVSQIGLTLNPVAKEAYLVPRYTNGKIECVLEPSYVGLQKLLTDCGIVKNIITNLVYENDKIVLNLADTTNPVIHNPELSMSKRGGIIGCYSVATLDNDIKQVEWMSVEEIHVIRERSESYKSFVAGKSRSCIWESDYGEMCRKTVIKRIYKYLPRTKKLEAVDNAIALSNVDYEITEEQRDYILLLAEKLQYTDEQVRFLKQELNSMNSDAASSMIEQMKTDIDSYADNPNYSLRLGQKQIAKSI